MEELKKENKELYKENDELILENAILQQKVEKYENITFESTSVKSLGAGKLSISGKFSMHGITKNITLIATYKVGTNIANQKTIAGFKLNGKLSRKDFGIGGSTPVAVVGDEVNFKVNLEMVKD